MARAADVAAGRARSARRSGRLDEAAVEVVLDPAAAARSDPADLPGRDDVAPVGGPGQGGEVVGVCLADPLQRVEHGEPVLLTLAREVVEGRPDRVDRGGERGEQPLGEAALDEVDLGVEPLCEHESQGIVGAVDRGARSVAQGGSRRAGCRGAVVVVVGRQPRQRSREVETGDGGGPVVGAGQVGDITVGDVPGRAGCHAVPGGVIGPSPGAPSAASPCRAGGAR